MSDYAGWFLIGWVVVVHVSLFVVSNRVLSLTDFVAHLANRVMALEEKGRKAGGDRE